MQPVRPEQIETQVVARIRAAAFAPHMADHLAEPDPHARAAIHLDPAKIQAVNAKIAEFEPKLKAFVATFGPVLPAQVPVIVNSLLAIYDALNPQPAPAA